ncbi:RNA polymerase sigma factor SigJ [Nocardioides sp.]|uniref:RNA polymerase sigma factor SigJ n=1 Tax=Nocardioides sp. TaxID=35761 RepID=UPI0027215C08|nr:RNA polymerase sigma factor SigJ [Nocardioides sp.]MDO9455544.1 RNA polymerase sigma factor SigJ [Nocardioides sp.]
MSVEALAEEYAEHRARLVRVAYAILGSRAEAEDVVADCWLRLVAADEREPVRDVLGWATVAVSRASIDVLRSARVRREAYVGPWLPEPEVRAADPAADPADRVTLDDTVRYALLVVLEQLTPAERTAWVLHDLFELPFDEVARAVGRSPEAVRQLARRARAHVVAGTPHVDVDASTHGHVVTAFLTAAAGGDLAGLVSLLDPAVVLTSDGGGVVSAARRPVVGPDRVARFMAGIASRPGAASYRPVEVNGRLGLAATNDGRAFAVLSFTVDDGLVTRIDIVLAPDKLPDRAARPIG